MALTTANFGLIKPELTDPADITALNKNWDKIDEQLLKAGESGGSDLAQTEPGLEIEETEGEVDEYEKLVINRVVNEVIEEKDVLTKDDVVDNLESSAKDLPLSANQGLKLKKDINSVDNRVTENLTIRFNESAEVVQIYKDGVWQDWLTINHDGIIVVSEAKVILNSSNVNTGSDVSGGWTPSGQFLAIDNTTLTSESNNMISLNNVKHIDFTYSFIDISNAGAITSNATFSAYVLDESGNKVLTSSTNSSKGNGTFTLSLNTSGLTGMYKIGYILDPYYLRIPHETWNEYQGARVSISKIALYTM